MKITSTTLRRIIKEELDAVMNEEDKNVARARKAKHIGKAFDVRQNKFQLDPEYQKGAKAMRDRVAKLKAKKKGRMDEAEGSEAQVAADMAAALAEVPAVQAAVERARQDPDVQAALADLMASRDAIAEELGLGPSKYQTAMGTAAAGGLLGMAGLLATSNAAAVAPFLAAVAPLAAPLGLSGVGLLALSALIASGKDK